MSEGEEKIEQGSAAVEPHPLEQLASISLDAADAANDSAEVAITAISKLDRVISITEESTSSLKRAPLILAAVILAVGVGLGVTVAIVFTRLAEKVESVNQSLSMLRETDEKVKEGLKDLSHLEENLKKFEGVAADTTQRAIVTLREQVKTDRLAAQQLEVRRINDMVASLRSSLGPGSRTAPVAPSSEQSKLESIERGVKALENERISALEKSLSRITAKLDEISKAVASNESKPVSNKAFSSSVEAQNKDLTAMKTEIAALRGEIISLKASFDRKPADPSASTLPSYRKP